MILLDLAFEKLFGTPTKLFIAIDPSASGWRGLYAKLGFWLGLYLHCVY